MKLLVLSILLSSSMSFAAPSPNTCDSGCGNITKAQSDCVVKTRCNAEIRKILREKKKLQAEVERLRRKIYAMKSCQETLEKVKSYNTVDNTKRQRFNVMLGNGPLGNLVVDGRTVKTETGAVMGAQYVYDLTNRFNINAQVQTNEFFGIGLGLNF